MPFIHKDLLRQHNSCQAHRPQPDSRLQFTSTLPPAQSSKCPAEMCGPKAATNMPPQVLEPTEGDHILSPHIEVAHRVNVSIVLSSGAITMMVAGIILWILIKRRLVRCCEKENPAHLLEQGGDRGNAKMAYLPPLGFQLTAPAVLHHQLTQAPSLSDIENTLARMQVQYAAMANQLFIQREHVEQQKTSGVTGAPRLNQYPVV